ncbi:MAG: hypothetical protein R2848_05830 [Thermomicrobiales bacterium]
MDANRIALAISTDDGYVRPVLESGSDNPEQFFLDIAPAWTPDDPVHHLLPHGIRGPVWPATPVRGVPAVADLWKSSRRSRTSPEPGISRANGRPTVNSSTTRSTTAIPTTPDTGIWVYRAAGEIRKLAMSDAELGPLVLMQVSPAGNRLLAYYPMALMQSAYWGKSVLRFVDPVTGDVSQVPDPAPESEVFEGTWLATFSPMAHTCCKAVEVSSIARILGDRPCHDSTR